jgi:hypothetical protein
MQCCLYYYYNYLFHSDFKLQRDLSVVCDTNGLQQRGDIAIFNTSRRFHDESVHLKVEYVTR